jgi:DNA modification methylase
MQAQEQPACPDEGLEEDLTEDWDRLFLEPTTCWDFPYQSPGRERFGDHRYHGVTPSPCVWNLVVRYTKPGDLVVDCMAGSGTTVDVARQLGRRAFGFDVSPRGPHIIRNDARRLPLENDSVDLHIVDSPYSDNVRYSSDERCLGRLSSEDASFYREMASVAREIHRTLRPGGVLAWIIADQFKGRRFTPVGFRMLSVLGQLFEPVDIVIMVNRNGRTLNPLWEHRARKYNFFLRGFKYVFILRKPEESQWN